ncbi:hypothetical protein C2845_PM01G32260 [Panicum miliaceum]|uniref:Uncharacterized protein n=1 Tax=Panicum miliaceum TaxID=4540 RepID=A0A3L6TQI7_PANMI|nr:hypothetical protein C2845_PM01G32260 [Panicum miliaceum]
MPHGLASRPRLNRCAPLACAIPSAALRPPRAAEPDAAVIDALKMSRSQNGDGASRRPSASTPPVSEKHLGLGWMLPSPPLPKPHASSSVSAKGSSRGSISGLKRKICEGACASASHNAARGVSVSPASSSAPPGSEPKVSMPSEDANQLVSSESDTPTLPPETNGQTQVEGSSGAQTQAQGTADIVNIDDDEEVEAQTKAHGTADTLDEFIGIINNLYHFYAASKPSSSKSVVNENEIAANLIL